MLSVRVWRRVAHCRHCPAITPPFTPTHKIQRGNGITDLGYACERGTERRELGPPDRLDETTELVYYLQPAGSAVFILVFPA